MIKINNKSFLLSIILILFMTGSIFATSSNIQSHPISQIDEFNLTGLNITLNTNYTLYTGNLSIMDKITFRLGEWIDNLVDGWLTITGNLNVTGNITADYFLGNGSQLTGITGGNSSWNQTFADTLYIGTGYNPFNQSLNTTDGVTFKKITIGTTDVNQIIQFYDSGSTEQLYWDTSNNWFEFTDGLTVNGNLEVDAGGTLNVEGVIVGSSTIHSFSNMYSEGYLYTTRAGGDLWLGNITQANALFQANTDGTVNATNITANYFIGDGSKLTGITGDNSSWNQTYATTLYIGSGDEGNLNVNSSNFWDIYNVPTDLNNLLTLHWDNITSKSTYLSNFTDDILWTTVFNATGDTRWLTSFTETDPLWASNETNVAFKNEANVFTADQSLTNQNISAINCIIFDSGGKICSGV